MPPTAELTPAPTPLAKDAQLEDPPNHNGAGLLGATNGSKINGLPSPSLSATSENHVPSSPPLTDQSHPIPPELEASGPQSRAQARIRSWGDNWETKRFPRLSKPVEVMRHSYDVVVIGSGYGGGVAASRMARAGKHVCLLERGAERWPGEYPVSPADAIKQLHVSGEFAPRWLPGVAVEEGDPTGMYHLILGRGQNTVVGNGEYNRMRCVFQRAAFQG